MDFDSLPTDPINQAKQPQQGPVDFDSLPDDSQNDQNVNEEKYGTLGQQALTVGEGALKGLAGPIATAAEAGLSKLGVPGLTPEEQAGRQATNPVEHGLSEGLTFAGSMLAGVGEAALLEHAGQAGASALGLGAEGANLASRIGSHAVNGAIGNALFTAGDVASNIINGQNPSEAVQTALPALGLSAVLGGAIGGGIGGVSELWKATQGADTAGVLRAITDRLGGAETIVSDPVSRALETVGVKPSPEIVAAMSSDPSIQRMAKALEQSDATSSGIAYQSALKDFHEQTQDAIASTFGKTPEEMAEMPIKSNYEVGKNLGQTLADEYQSKLDPTIKSFEKFKDQTIDVPLAKDSTELSMYGRSVVPGTASQIKENLISLASKEGWERASTDINRELKRVMNAIKQKTTLGQLTDLITQVGNNTKSTLPGGMQTPLSRAGSLIKNVLRDAQDSLTVQHLGAASPELLPEYWAAQGAYKAQAALKDALNDRLRIGGSVSGFAKGLKEMATTDGEGVLRKLNGAKDANLLSFLSDNFPKTAEALKDYHIGNLIDNSVSGAKAGEGISITKLQKAIGAMPEELRNFAVPKQTLNKLEGMSVLQDQLNQVPHNFTNTARASGVMNKYGIGSAMGLVSMLTGHGALASLATGQLAHVLSKSAPDATRLALLKFLGSDKEINATAFKSMINFIQSASKGENLTVNASKALFNAGSKILPDELIPNKQSRENLEKALDKSNDINHLSSVGSGFTHYLPEHSMSAVQLSTAAKQYLDALKPQVVKQSPLDATPPVSKGAQHAYNNALDIAEQPLYALQKVKDGTIQPQDIQTLNTIYPNLYAKMKQNTFESMTAAIDEGKTIPYSQKQSLSLFMGEPLDSTMTQASMMAATMANAGAQKTQPLAQQRQYKPSTKALSTIEKVNTMYQTPQQSREGDRKA